MQTWFHYARKSRVKEYIEDGAITGHNPFIRRRFASASLPESLYALPTIWGLHAQESTEILSHAMLKDIAYGEELYLLEITPTDNDALYVCDVGVFNIPPIKDTQKALERAKQLHIEYFNSLVRFEDYKPGTYKKPEVVCFTPIPKERYTGVSKTDEFVSKIDDTALIEAMIAKF